MLMIEKQKDVRMLQSMGAGDRLIRRIFIYEGNMISVFGALAGILMGVTLCLIQQKFGIIKLGEMGTFLTNDYPVRVSSVDLLLILATVCTIGLLTSWYTVRYFGKKWLNNSRLAICLLPLLLTGCKGLPSNRPSVAVTIEPQCYFAEKIAGDQYEIYAVVPAGQSPESYDPAPHEMICIAQSSAYLQIGGIGFEQAWMDIIRENNPHLKFFDMSEGIHLIGEDIEEFNVKGLRTNDEEFNPAEDDHHHHHGGVDPHIWSAPGTAKIIAQNTLNAFLALDPDNQVVYRENYRQLMQEIDDTERQLHSMLDTLTHRTFVIYHPALTYFENEFALKQLTIESEGKEPSVASLKQLIDEAKKAQVRVIFVQQEFDSKHAEQVAAEIGVRTVVINPLDRRWNEQMMHIAKELIK
jgi:zinc transport system substrate-binding protein